MKPNLTPEQAEAILKRDDLNTIEKSSKGKNLSVDERKRLEKIVKAGSVKLPQQIATAKPGNTERAYLTQKRRNRVFDLRSADFSIREMAEKLGCSTNTIVKDLRALDAQLNATIDLTQTQRHVNNLLRMHERVIVRCQSEIERKGLTGNELSSMLSCIQKAGDAIARLKENVGVIPKAITNVRAELSGPDAAPLAMGTVVVYLPENGRTAQGTEP